MKTNTGGYIKIHRKLMEDEFWRSEPFTRAQAWLDLLMLATWEPHRAVPVRRNHCITIKRGEIAQSIGYLSQRWQWGGGKVRQYLHTLEELGRIKIRHSNLVNVISIAKYNLYQSGATENPENNSVEPNFSPDDQPTGGTTLDTTGEVTDGATGLRGLYSIKCQNLGANRATVQPTVQPTGRATKYKEIKNIRKEIITITPVPEEEPVGVIVKNIIPFNPSEPPVDEQPENRAVQGQMASIVQRLVKTGAFNDITAEAFCAKYPLKRIEYALQALEVAIEAGKELYSPAGYFHAAFREWLPGMEMPREKQNREKALDPELSEKAAHWRAMMGTGTEPRQGESR